MFITNQEALWSEVIFHSLFNVLGFLDTRVYEFSDIIENLVELLLGEEHVALLLEENHVLNYGFYEVRWFIGVYGVEGGKNLFVEVVGDGGMFLKLFF